MISKVFNFKYFFSQPLLKICQKPRKKGSTEHKSTVGLFGILHIYLPPSFIETAFKTKKLSQIEKNTRFLVVNNGLVHYLPPKLKSLNVNNLPRRNIWIKSKVLLGGCYLAEYSLKKSGFLHKSFRSYKRLKCVHYLPPNPNNFSWITQKPVKIWKIWHRIWNLRHQFVYITCFIILNSFSIRYSKIDFHFNPNLSYLYGNTWIP